MNKVIQCAKPNGVSDGTNMLLVLHFQEYSGFGGTYLLLQNVSLPGLSDVHNPNPDISAVCVRSNLLRKLLKLVLADSGSTSR